MPGKPLRVLIAPSSESEATLYEDDGESMRYRDGDFMTRRFRQTGSGASTVVEISAPEGKYRPAARDLVLELWMDNAPRSVADQAGEDLPHLDESGPADSAGGWYYAAGVLKIEVKDRFEPVRFAIKR